MKPGRLYPILCAEALPSEVWQYDANALMRMAPMIAPIMHEVDVCVHSFFNPERLTQDRNAYETFITGGRLGDGKNAQGNTIEAVYFTVSGSPTSPARFNITEYFFPGSLGDFLGVQYPVDGVLGTDEVSINARPFIAFWRIWCEYFRDQTLDYNFVDHYPNIFDSEGGDISAEIYAAINSSTVPFPFFYLPQVCWEKDYFTSALPFAQRGEPVETPLTGTGQVVYKDQAEWLVDGIPNVNAGSDQYMFIQDATPNIQTGSVLGSPSAGAKGIDNIEEINFQAAGFTITALRTAARLQEWLEKMATGGARYIEQIKSVFGVTSSDARLQRPEYLGGGKIPMHISEVIQNSADDGTPLAEMAGHGVTAGQVTAFRKFCEEHGHFLVFLYLRPKTAYQEGVPRMFTDRFDKLDYAWPQFARIGEQEVLRRELYFTSNEAQDTEVFGYQQRYAEYKYIPSTVHGEFRTSLDHWHWGRIFGPSVPSLSPEFVHCDPSSRIFNVLSEGTDSLYVTVTNRITARRPLPYYGEPTL